MLDHALNESISRVGPGTPMGVAMRRYWLPALLSMEIPDPDGPPVRVTLMGERLLAFRSTDGNIGLVQEACPHRRASLYFGRNEECGIRCVYHGWKFDIEGNCVDQMNEPKQFSDRVKITAYPTLEMGGCVWAYMGPTDKKPAPPAFELTQVPETHRYMTKVWQECNWLQAMEGGIDTSHAPILHRKLTDDTDEPGISPSSPFLQGAAPDLEVETTDYGFRYFGIRPIGEDKTFVRGYHYVMPFTQLRPAIFGCLWMTTTSWYTTGATVGGTIRYLKKKVLLRTQGTISKVMWTLPTTSDRSETETTTICSTEMSRRLRRSLGFGGSMPKIGLFRRAWAR